jgi:hypothetical protein
MNLLVGGKIATGGPRGLILINPPVAARDACWGSWRAEGGKFCRRGIICREIAARPAAKPIVLTAFFPGTRLANP